MNSPLSFSLCCTPDSGGLRTQLERDWRAAHAEPSWAAHSLLFAPNPQQPPGVSVLKGQARLLPPACVSSPAIQEPIVLCRCMEVHFRQVKKRRNIKYYMICSILYYTTFSNGNDSIEHQHYEIKYKLFIIK